MTHRSQAAQWIRPAAGLGVAAPLTILFAAIAADIGWLSFDIAFGLLTLKVGFWLALVGTVVGLILTGLAFRDLGRLWPWVLAALVAPALTLGGYLWLQARADALPPIHETATDWTDPLGFSGALLVQRGDAAWPISGDPTISGSIGDVRPEWARWAGRRVAEANAEACPQARTVPRLVEPEEVIEALEAEGVRVFGQSPWRVEGTRDSAFFGRARDVVVRMEPGATDIRVVERRGLIDLGDTCDLAARVSVRLGSGE